MLPHGSQSRRHCRVPSCKVSQSPATMRTAARCRAHSVADVPGSCDTPLTARRYIRAPGPRNRWAQFPFDRPGMNTHIIPVPVDLTDNNPHHILAEFQDPFPDNVRDEEKRNIRLDLGGSPGHQTHPGPGITVMCRSNSLSQFPRRPDSVLTLHGTDSSNATNLSIPLHFFLRIPSDTVTTGIVGSRQFLLLFALPILSAPSLSNRIAATPGWPGAIHAPHILGDWSGRTYYYRAVFWAGYSDFLWDSIRLPTKKHSLGNI